MRIGVGGKGGVGKTTVSALLARTLAERGLRVLAVDTDSNPNLGLSLGLSLEQTERVPVLPRSVIVGSGGDVTSDTLVREYGRATPAGATLLSGIRVSEAGGGCTCGGHATVRSLLGEVLDSQADVTLVDMEAGLEHLSRSGGTLAYVDALVVVVEASRKAVLTAARTAALAAELGIPRCVGVGNNAASEAEAAFLREAMAARDLPLLAIIPHDPGLADAERAGQGLPDQLAPEVRSAVEELIAGLRGALALA